MRNAGSAVVSNLAPSGFLADVENLAPRPAGIIVHRPQNASFAQSRQLWAILWEVSTAPDRLFCIFVVRVSVPWIASQATCRVDFVNSRPMRCPHPLRQRRTELSRLRQVATCRQTVSGVVCGTILTAHSGRRKDAVRALRPRCSCVGMAVCDSDVAVL